MTYAPQHEFSAKQEKTLHKARKLEYWSIAYMISVVVLMYLTMGGSQAMKSALFEDVLTLIPSIAFLVSSHICWRSPTRNYPYGFHRAVSIAFLVAAVALLGVGLYIFEESLSKLIRQEHPTIGLKHLFGHDVWEGWLMLPVLLWSVVIPVFLGRWKMALAPQLNDKVLYTDADMNKADWMTGAVAAVGVVGTGFGIWWLDAAAAIFISFDIVKDGFTQTRDALLGLIDHAPTNLDGDFDDLPEKVTKALCELDWVEDAEVRLHEQGHLIFGEGFVSLHDRKTVRQEEVTDAIKMVEKLDWRLQGFCLSLKKQ